MIIFFSRKKRKGLECFLSQHFPWRGEAPEITVKISARLTYYLFRSCVRWRYYECGCHINSGPTRGQGKSRRLLLRRVRDSKKTENIYFEVFCWSYRTNYPLAHVLLVTWLLAAVAWWVDRQLLSMVCVGSIPSMAKVPTSMKSQKGSKVLHLSIVRGEGMAPGITILLRCHRDSTTSKTLVFCCLQ